MERLLKRLYEETLTTYTEEDLLNLVEDNLYEIKELKDKIEELETPEEEPDDYEERLIRRCQE